MAPPSRQKRACPLRDTMPPPRQRVAIVDHGRLPGRHAHAPVRQSATRYAGVPELKPRPSAARPCGASARGSAPPPGPLPDTQRTSARASSRVQQRRARAGRPSRTPRSSRRPCPRRSAPARRPGRGPRRCPTVKRNAPSWRPSTRPLSHSTTSPARRSRASSRNDAHAHRPHEAHPVGVRLVPPRPARARRTCARTRGLARAPPPPAAASAPARASPTRHRKYVWSLCSSSARMQARAPVRAAPHAPVVARGHEVRAGARAPAPGTSRT